MTHRDVSRTLGALVALALLGCSSVDQSPPSGSLLNGGSDAGGAAGALPQVSGGAGAGAAGGGVNGGAANGGAANGGASAGAASAGNGATAGAAGQSGVHQFSIRFDYRFDTVGYFTAPERRAALEAAGALWSRFIRDDFPTIPKGTRLRIRNPENRDEYVWVEGIESDIDDLLVFVGTSEAIVGLGRGGPSGAAESTDAALSAALAVRRDNAPFQPWAGSITFKASSNFFFDSTPSTSDDIPFEAYDFISNASHEIGHILGFASCNAFTALVDGASFTGAKAMAAYGGPVPLTLDAGHFADGMLSGGKQPLMDPSQSNGLRLAPTQLDLALFADLGYQLAK